MTNPHSVSPHRGKSFLIPGRLNPFEDFYALYHGTGFHVIPVFYFGSFSERRKGRAVGAG